MDKVTFERRPGGGGQYTLQVSARRQISRALGFDAGAVVCLRSICKSTIANKTTSAWHPHESVALPSVH